MGKRRCLIQLSSVGTVRESSRIIANHPEVDCRMKNPARTSQTLLHLFRFWFHFWSSGQCHLWRAPLLRRDISFLGMFLGVDSSAYSLLSSFVPFSLELLAFVSLRCPLVSFSFALFLLYSLFSSIRLLRSRRRFPDNFFLAFSFFCVFLRPCFRRSLGVFLQDRGSYASFRVMPTGEPARGNPRDRSSKIWPRPPRPTAFFRFSSFWGCFSVLTPLFLIRFLRLLSSLSRCGLGRLFPAIAALQRHYE